MQDRRRFLAWIAVAAAIGLPGWYYWALDDPPVSGSAMRDNVPVISMSSKTTRPAPVPVAGSRVRLVVNGVVVAAASRAALIAVDDRPAALFAEGAQVADGLVLFSVGADRIVVKRGDELLRLPLRGKGSAEGAANAIDRGDSSSDYSTVPQTPLPPAGTEERRIYQSRD